MKENNQQRQSAASRRALMAEFLMFLLEPEDTGRTAEMYGRRRRPTRFDNRHGGAIKIFFWLGVTILFWGGIPDLCTMVVTALQR